MREYVDHHSVKASKQSDYPILDPPEVDIILFPSLQELIKISDLIIEGTVVDVIQPYSYYDITIYSTKISIDNTLKGKSVNKVITLSSSGLTIAGQPKLTLGEKMIFCMIKGSTSDEYIIVSPHEGFFYIAADNKVYPVEVTDGLKETSGMSLNVFRRTVKSFAK